ncbi:hypothetical protein BH11ACT3_BH11ACT3_09590 [soil metagenome]
MAEHDHAEDPHGPTAAIIGEDNTRPVWLLERAVKLARAVARISLPDINGTGFLIASDVLLTNNHVIPDEQTARAAEIWFNDQATMSGAPREPYKVLCAPHLGFHTSPAQEVGATADALDFTVVKLAERVGRRFGRIPLDAWAEVEKDDSVAIVQHIDGQPKSVAMSDNQVAFADEFVVHYLTDTNGGSSGAPVFNDRWEVVALHHGRGDPDPNAPDPRFRDWNEGIRMSAIIGQLPTWAGGTK